MPYFLVKTPNGYGVVSFYEHKMKYHSKNITLNHAKTQLRILNSLHEIY
jgi:hypothetical protein